MAFTHSLLTFLFLLLVCIFSFWFCLFLVSHILGLFVCEVLRIFALSLLWSYLSLCSLYSHWLYLSLMSFSHYVRLFLKIIILGTLGFQFFWKHTAILWISPCNPQPCGQTQPIGRKVTPFGFWWRQNLRFDFGDVEGFQIRWGSKQGKTVGTYAFSGSESMRFG